MRLSSDTKENTSVRSERARLNLQLILNNTLQFVEATVKKYDGESFFEYLRTGSVEANFKISERKLKRQGQR